MSASKPPKSENRKMNLEESPNVDLEETTLADDARSEAGKHFGLGIGFTVAGLGVLANQFGWTNLDWFLPAILIGYGAYYLYQALTH
jgi:hypothetical protein